MRYWSYVLVNMCLRSIAWPLVTINHGSEHLLFTFCLVIVDRSVVQVALLKDDVDGRVSRWRRWWVSGPESNAWDIFTLTCEFGCNKMKEFWSGDQVRDLEYMSEVVVSMLTFYYDNPSANLAEAYSFFCKICAWKNKNKQKEVGVGPLK